MSLENNVFESEYESDLESVSSDENFDHCDNLELTGGVLRNYNIICELGRGAFSIVWLAYSISNNKFFALKVQNPKEYKDGISEIKFVEKLPKNPLVFNNILEYFVEERKKQKYLCSVWELHYGNIDEIIRKSNISNGMNILQVKKIMKQLVEAVKILHKKFKVFHGDIKTDNILIKGINDKDLFIITKYKELNFIEKYTTAKKNFWINQGKDLKNIDNMNKTDKLLIRQKIHIEITTQILEEYTLSDIVKHSINNKYLNEMNVSLADFGMYCEEHNYYDTPFGTRYYQAPEIILMGKCQFPVDIWAIGCTFYELISGKLLFDPIKDSKYSRDYYHLSLICDTCGIFPKKFIEKTKYYRKYFLKNFELVDYEYPKESRLERKLNELELDANTKDDIKRILTKTLQIDPNKRWTIDELSNDSFFKD
jgi:serine/threonine protein kinase